MKLPDANLENLNEIFPDDFSPEQLAKAKTVFLKELSLGMHSFYGGKIQVLPRISVPGFNWFGVWYTPGVASVSTAIRDDNDRSFSLSARGNMVAVVSDSTRVLGDGNCTPPGGLGVMEGKAFIMKYLGGIDSVPLCIDSRDYSGKNNPDKIIDFVKMVEPSFGAVNLEDISQPNCYRVLDVLRDECEIPVWHDDAQGTACVTLAAAINAFKLAGKKIRDGKIVLLGSGASNSSVARLLIADGFASENIVMFDKDGALHRDRFDIRDDARFYRQWELCQKTNSGMIKTHEEAFKGADAVIAFSSPGPDSIKADWIRSMAEKPIVFACANPVPEIYPYAAKDAGAFIVATGRADFPNQVNNSVGFPAILKGALMARARKITDGMAIRAAHSIAAYSESKGISPDHIIAAMDDADLFPAVAADVAVDANEEKVSRVNLSWEEAFSAARRDIQYSRDAIDALSSCGVIKEPPAELIKSALECAVKSVRGVK